MKTLDALRGFFKFEERRTNFPTEIVAGVTTFATMSYIIFLQPAIMSGRLMNSSTGMDFGALLTTVCLASAFGSLLMGIVANYPVALAPGMGENFLFAIAAVPACAAILGCAKGDPGAWKLALGIVFVSGVAFAIVSFCNIRNLMVAALSFSMKSAIAAGIGLFIAFLGLRNSGLVEISGGNLSMNLAIGCNSQTVFLSSFIIAAALIVLNVRGAILWGIAAGAFAAWAMGLAKFGGFFSLPPDPSPVFAQMDLEGVFSHFWKVLPFLLIFFCMDLFDTLGTLVGVGSQAGLLKRDGYLVDAERAFASDALGTVFGAVAGHSTTTAYIESAAGIEQGGRTGMTAVVAGFCFLLAMFVAPLVETISSCPAACSAALVIVGAMMMRNAVKIEWADPSEAIPAFMVICCIPFFSNIGDGLILGFVLYPLIKLLGGRAKELNWLSWALAGALVLYLLLVKR